MRLCRATGVTLDWIYRRPLKPASADSRGNRTPQKGRLHGIGMAQSRLRGGFCTCRDTHFVGNRVSGRTSSTLANANSWCMTRRCRPFSMLTIEVLESPTRRPSFSWLRGFGRCSRRSRTRVPKVRYTASKSRFFIARMMPTMSISQTVSQTNISELAGLRSLWELIAGPRVAAAATLSSYVPIVAVALATGRRHPTEEYSEPCSRMSLSRPRECRRKKP
jgi:hypothetical protein